MYRCNCGEDFNDQVNLDDHKRNCRNRYWFCELCDENIPTDNRGQHLIICGNKTTKCRTCHKYIRRAIYNFHVENDCMDLDEDGNVVMRKDSKSETERYSTAASHTNYNITRQERTSNKDNDDTFIPCQFCNQQIEISLYEDHSLDCSRNEHRYEQCVSWSPVTSNDYEKDVESKSNKNHSDTTLTNSETGRASTKERSISLLHKKTADVQDELVKNYYLVEVNHVTEKLQFNVVLTGSPRVGKSQLINALCGQQLAETSASLNSCTKEVKRYKLEDDQERTPGIKPFQINFYDTPGIESWTKEGGKSTMLKFIEEQEPICLIFCASPGAFVDLPQVKSVLEYCREKKIFCALVCTNMWSNPNRKVVIEEFQKELAIFGEPVEKVFGQGNNRPPHKVTVFGHSALCTMVNSVEYFDPDLSLEEKPVQGIDELIHCIMEELDQEKLLGWCNAVLYRRTFWEKINQKANGFFSSHLPNIMAESYRQADEIARELALRLSNMFRNNNE